MPHVHITARGLLTLVLLLSLFLGLLPRSTTAAGTPASDFHVPTPHPVHAAAFSLVEGARLVFLKLATRSRSSYVETRVGKAHVLRCPGQRTRCPPWSWCTGCARRATTFGP